MPPETTILKVNNAPAATLMHPFVRASSRTRTRPQISVCRLRFCWDFAAQDFPDAAGRIDFFQLVVTSFCIECPVGSLALAAVPRHPDPGFLEPKSRECNGQELIEYMAAGIY